MTATPDPFRRVFREVRCEVLRGWPAPDAEESALIQSRGFTRSDVWVRLRYEFLRDHGGRCRCCGRGAADGVKVNVDHILPRRTHPQFALTYANLQVLCGPCNRGKGNRDRTDWRYVTHGRTAIGQVATPCCPACGTSMRRREGAHGVFWGCGRFPACRATRPCDDPGTSGRR